MAFCLNEAIYIFGVWVENSIEEARTEATKHKRDVGQAVQKALRKCLGGDASKIKPAAQQFRDPRELLSRAR